MEALKILEQQVTSLIALVKELRKTNGSLESKLNKLQTQSDNWVKENKELKTANASLTEENVQLATKLSGLEGSVQQGNQTIHKLSEEQESAKLAIDDLIKSINDLVTEKQR
jgi:chromosome segregation ATPase